MMQSQIGVAFAEKLRRIRLNSLSVRTFAAITISMAASALYAQLPSAQLDGIFPLGAAPGAEFELKITGDDLDEVDRLLFSHGGITATQKMAEPTRFEEGPQPVVNTFSIKVADNVPAGKYQVRCHG